MQQTYFTTLKLRDKACKMSKGTPSSSQHKSNFSPYNITTFQQLKRN